MVQPETVQCVDQTAGTTRRADYLNFLVEAEMKAIDPDQCLDMDDLDADDFEVILDIVAAVFVSKESLRNPSAGVPSPDTTRH